MENSIMLLDAIYKNVDMARHAMDKIKGKINYDKLLKLADKQNKIYEGIIKDCNKFAKKYNHDLNGINGIAKLSSAMSISFKTLLDDSTCHISEMLIQGTTMGIIDVIKNIGKYNLADNDIKNTAVNLQHAEEEFIDSLKTFLVEQQ